MSSLTIYPKSVDPDVEIALDRYVCYPSEEVSVFVRGPQKDGEATVYIKLPDTVEVLSNGVENNRNIVLRTYGGPNFFSLTADMRTISEFRLRIRVSGLKVNHFLVFSAWTGNTPGNSAEVPETAARVRLAVTNNASYLKYLPEIYSYDDFMNRFLMFFESFWKPISQQIGQVEYYFDPGTTPEAFIPWLSSWIGISMDPSFPRDKRRDMIKQALSFFKYRGTIDSLKNYLEMYSSGNVVIRELKAKNMVLGPQTCLGEGIALGSDNRPNTVDIQVTVSQQELLRTGFDKDTYTQKLYSLAKYIIPAHTVYKIHLNVKN